MHFPAVDLDSEARLYTSNAEREKYESQATLFGIIVALEYLERAYVRDAINAAEYTPACTRLLSQYKTMLKLVGDSVPSVEEFMRRYNMDHPAALHRVQVGVPATIEHSSEQQGSSETAKWVAETTQSFITFMDALNLRLRAKDQLHPRLQELMTGYARFKDSAKWEGRGKIVSWLITLNAMKASDEITEDQARQLTWGRKRHSIDLLLRSLFVYSTRPLMCSYMIHGGDPGRTLNTVFPRSLKVQHRPAKRFDVIVVVVILYNGLVTSHDPGSYPNSRLCSSSTVFSPSINMFAAVRSANLMTRQSAFHLQRRTVISLAKIQYTAHATASGAGRNGTTQLDDGSLSINLASPKEMGGSGQGNNPEQLFALGYASCFLGALQLVAKNKNVKLSNDVKIKAAVSFGEVKGSGGFGIGVELTAIGADASLVHEAHTFGIMFTIIRSSARPAIRRGTFLVPHRTVISLYTAHATASGAGWEGTTELDDRSLRFDLAIPKEMGGSGEGQNPDQLLALGYASCFLGALQLVAKNKNVILSDNVKVKAAISFGEAKDSGFGINIELTTIGVDSALAREAHSVCPYSRIFREGTEVRTKFE
ncbi:Vacuolar protein sorting-associated protein 28 [Ceratobasidium theobromae]|uniref:Vacuolar protein sorting-associated protein 28 n=1 Tax=Ceratobasidium theobromae TaxID=1582974 RepID=A0A5N5QWX3_9AGAM|nr:Vacuolar protein sorting-associated protein 28 [Ceratobasidium theobromae]